MNTEFSTTGLVPLVVGSQETFQASPRADRLQWPLASATLVLADPNGNQTSIPASVSAAGYAVLAGWTVVGPVGQWTRCWRVTGLDGVFQVSRPVAFEVITSP